MRLGYIAAFLVAGIVAGVLFPGKLTALFGAATLYVFLPALIFDGAWRLETQSMRRWWNPIALLAVPGVLCTAGIVAVCVHFAGGVSWSASLLLGAILSATDPVAVLAIFKRLKLPRPLTTIVESEALLNDAVAVVLYRAVLAATASAVSVSVWNVAGIALLGSVLGIVCGAVLGALAALIVGRLQRPTVYIAVTILGAYASYYVASRFDWSGIFAVLSFGIVLGVLQLKKMPESCAQGVDVFWDRVALAANAVLFFLIGAALDVTHLVYALPIALVTVAAVLAARFAIVYGLLEFSRPRLHLEWMTVVRMAGIRGALSLALALATPVGFLGRALIVDVTFVVVVVTLLVGSLELRAARPSTR